MFDAPLATTIKPTKIIVEAARFAIGLDKPMRDVKKFLAKKTVDGSKSKTVLSTIAAAIKRLLIKEGYSVSEAKFLFSHSGQDLENLRLGGQMPEGRLRAEMVESDQGRRITIELPDASKAAGAFLGLSNTQGGTLLINAILPPLGQIGPMAGTAQVKDFRLKQAPFLAQILSLTSFTGLVNTLGGEGISFANFELPFSYQNDKLQIRGARLYGPSLGMTGDGDIDIGRKVLDFDGTVVPAYNANTILNNIPVLGSLVGRKGEGVFALNYEIRGPFEKAQIAVNPLSALTPGFLRGIFQPNRDKLPDDVLAQIEAVRPKPLDENAETK